MYNYLLSFRVFGIILLFFEFKIERVQRYFMFLDSLTGKAFYCILYESTC